ncbi:hypothetical protein WN944_012867 [Citrus x changshan-huyou]|uniref:Uncharacterized protein n=1 Tax=Citrus x changshan-huyou TaxID=2935761 RepID=A0AAP0M3X4_9ROSI
MRGYIGATASRHSQIDCRAALLFWYGIGDLTPAQQESDGFASFFTKYGTQGFNSFTTELQAGAADGLARAP